MGRFNSMTCFRLPIVLAGCLFWVSCLFFSGAIDGDSYDVRLDSFINSYFGRGLSFGDLSPFNFCAASPCKRGGVALLLFLPDAAHIQPKLRHDLPTVDRGGVV
jgi:hypothetical protein